VIPAVMGRNFGREGIQKVGIRYYRILPNVKTADFVLCVEKPLPSFITPLFLQYNCELHRNEVEKGVE
jgi:hypothetical protein